MKRLPLVFLLLSGCAALDALVQKPKLRVAGVRPVAISLDTIDSELDLAIENPNGFGLSIAGIDFKLTVGLVPLLDAKTTSGLVIRSRATSTVPVAFAVPVIKLLEMVKNTSTSKEVAYRIEGGITLFASALGNVRLPFSHDGRLPIPRAPSFSLGDLAIEKVNLKSQRIRLSLNVDNPNLFSLAKLGGRLKLSLDDTDVGDVEAALDKPVESGQEGAGTVVAEVSALKLLPKLAGKRIKARLSGDLGADTPYGRLRLPLDLDKEVAIRR